MVGQMLLLTHHFESGLTSEIAEPAWVSVPPVFHCRRAISAQRFLEGTQLPVFITTCSCIPVGKASKGDEPGEVGGVVVIRAVCWPLAHRSTTSKPFQLAPGEQLWWRTDVGLLHSVELVQAHSNSSGPLLTMARLLLLWETNHILASGKDFRLNIYVMFIYLFFMKANKLIAYGMVRLKIRRCILLIVPSENIVSLYMYS